MNVVRVRVEVLETGVPVPKVQVVLYDADPSTKAEEAFPNGADIGDRVGARVTDKDGACEFLYEDVEFQVRNPDEMRPDLLLAVMAPEAAGLDEAHRRLYLAPEICQNAGRIEERVIRIPADTLKTAGVRLPLDHGATEESSAVVSKLNQAMTNHLEIQAETRKIATDQVAASRQQHVGMANTIQSRIYESLVGVSPEDAKRLNIVPPGEPAAPILFDNVNKTIANKVNAGPIAGYLILTEAEAQRFRTGTGYRDHIPAVEIEPIIYKVDQDARRPVSLVREDPVAAIHRTSGRPDPFEPTDDGNTPAGGQLQTPGPAGPGQDAELQLGDLPKFVGRLVGPIIPPEDATLSSNGGRPTSDDVQATVHGLQLRTGPADVPAYYDYHQLQIAFDYLWQHAIDDGVIEAAQQLATQLAQSGGDPVGAVSNASNPISGLRLEAQFVEQARTTLTTAGVMARSAPAVLPNGHADPPPRPIVRPPITRPPFDGGPGGLPTSGLPGRDAIAPPDLLSILDDLLSERYKFEVLAPGTTNFGLLVTYRERWEPITYQVGSLVKTLTLAPKETRKVTSKRVVKVDRSVKEMQDNQRNRKDETSDTMRSEAEIVQKAQDTTNFNATAKGNYDIGISSGDATSSLTRDAQASSQETKKSFHEGVLKAAQEFRDERKIEVETKLTEEEETVETAEISNPNDELTVTYLFYELQRRFRVSEHIHKLTPVVLVAMEVPNPSRTAIDKVLLAHAWIINRVLLDDRYRSALDYLCNRVVGDELALRDMAQNVANTKASVDTLNKLHRDMEAELAAREAALTAAIERRAEKIANENTEGSAEKAYEWVVGSGDEEDLEAARIREDLSKERYERAVREEKDLRMRLDAETAALTAAQEAYSRANAEHSNHLLQIAGLRLHFKENLLYYMQAIWSFTFRDQIFSTLSSVKVPRITATQKTYSLVVPEVLPVSIPTKPGQVVLEVHADIQLKTGLDPATDFVSITEIADLDAPPRARGNCLIFPLRESNPLTDYMMLPYLDSELGIHDPDDLGGWTPEDFVKYARQLQQQLKDQLSEAEYKALQDRLREQYRRIVSSPRVFNDEVIVPTTSLYIEALPGAHPLLEDFKLLHRLIDVKKAQGEARKVELENLRYAARLLDDKFEDPDVDRRIEINGTPAGVVVPADS